MTQLTTIMDVNYLDLSPTYLYTHEQHLFPLMFIKYLLT